MGIVTQRLQQAGGHKLVMRRPARAVSGLRWLAVGFAATLALGLAAASAACGGAPDRSRSQRAREAPPGQVAARVAFPRASGERDREQLPRGNRDYSPRVSIAASPSPGPAAGWDTERLWSLNVDWEPHVATDPSSSYVYQMATRYYASCAGCPDPAMVFRRSANGGATWGQDAYPFPAGRSQNDPQLAVDAAGTLYAAFLQDFRPGVVFTRSTDRGSTWSEPIHFTGEKRPRWSDHPLLLVSNSGRDIYVAFNASDSYIVVSHDSGATFSTPVRTNNDKRYWFHTGGAIATDGTVYVATADYTQSFRGKVNISVLVSTDGGVNWLRQRIDVSTETPQCTWAEGCYLGFLGPQADLAIDESNTLMLVYTAGRRAGRSHRVWYRTSTDGISWSRRRRLSRPGAGVNNAFGLVSAGPGTGDFRVVWQDDRRRRTDRWNTWYRRTADGGANWSRAVRLSRGGPITSYKDNSGYAFPYGDYFRFAVDQQGTNHVIWGAGESYSGNGGVWYTRGR